jgi:tetratricopeptide (TPR) repeat protein
MRGHVVKIAVYAVGRDQAGLVDRWLASASEADFVFLADAGSQDGTADKARAGGATVATLAISPWRFDKARNVALMQLPDDIDLCIALDLDEVLVPGWRAVVEAAVAANPEARQFRYESVRSWQEDGRPGVTLYDDRIHKRSGFTWLWPVHEMLVADTPRVALIEQVLVERRPGAAPTPWNMEELLRRALVDHPTSGRMAHYYGRLLMEQGRHKEALVELDCALKHEPTSAAERATTWRFKGRCHWLLREFDEAEAAYVKATEVAPFLREPWVDLAQGNYTFGMWAKCREACERALAITDRTIYENEPVAWSDWPERMRQDAIDGQMSGTGPKIPMPDMPVTAASQPPKKLKIAVYAIAKNEAQFVERCLTAAADADYILIADTGSTDGTIEIARRMGARVESISISPWRFDDARNAALALIPADIDFCVSVDLDEVLQPGWRAAIEEAYAAKPETNQFMYHFISSWTSDGRPGYSFYNERIHARHGFRWKCPIHEYLRGPRYIRTRIDKTLVEHHPDKSKPRTSYLPMLKAAVREEPESERMAHLYGRELLDYRKYDEAIREFDRYLGLPRTHWAPEIATTLRYKARCHIALGQLDEALAALIRATETMPDTREPWFDLAHLYRRLGRWADCQAACEKVLSITTKAIHINDPRAWSDQPAKLLAEAVRKQQEPVPAEPAVQDGDLAALPTGA